MLAGLVGKAWLLILLYTGFMIWEMYIDHNDKLSTLEVQIPKKKQELRKKRNEKKQIEQYLKDIEKARDQIELVAQEVENVQKKLPDVIDDAANLRRVKEISDALNIKNIFLSPLSEENKGFYYTKKYELTGSGTFLQFLILLEKLADSHTLLNVSRVTITRPKRDQRGRFQKVNANIIIEAFRYNANHQEERGIADIEKQFTKTEKKEPVKKRRRRKK
jgi:Tfp pilus assembly protein PilO